MKKLMTLALTLVLIVGLVACSQDNQTADQPGTEETQDMLTTIKEKGELLMVTNANYAPFEFHKEIDGEDHILGLDLDIGKYIAEDLGVEFVVQDMEFNAALQSVATGMADVAIGGINPDPTRMETMDFTDAYYVSEYVVLVRAEDTGLYTGPQEMQDNNAVIGAQTGSTQEKMAMGIEGVDVLSIAELSDMIIQLQGGHLDAIILEDTVADMYAAANPDLAVDAGGDFDEIPGGVAIAVPKGNPEFVEYLNGVIAEMQEQNLIEEMYQKAVEQATN